MQPEKDAAAQQLDDQPAQASEPAAKTEAVVEEKQEALAPAENVAVAEAQPPAAE